MRRIKKASDLEHARLNVIRQLLEQKPETLTAVLAELQTIGNHQNLCKLVEEAIKYKKKQS